MVDEHPVATRGGRRLCGEQLVQQIDTLQELDDHALSPQVCSPHLLDELGVVLALDQDAAGQRDPGSLVGRHEGSGCRASKPLLLRRGNREAHRRSVDQEPAAEGEEALAPHSVLELDVAALHPRDRTAESVLRDLDHEIELGGDLRHRLLRALPPTCREHIRSVPVVHAIQRMCLR